MAAPSNEDFILPVNTVDGVPVAHAFNQTPSNGDYCIPVVGSDGVPVMRKVVSADATDDLCLPVITADGKVVLCKTEELLYYWMYCNSVQVRDPYGLTYGDILAYYKTFGAGGKGESYTNLYQTIPDGSSGFIRLGNFENSYLRVSVSWSTVGIHTADYLAKINVYGFSNTLDLNSITWATRPTGTLLTTFELKGSFSDNWYAVFDLQSSKDIIQLDANGYDIKAIRIAFDYTTSYITSTSDSERIMRLRSSLYTLGSSTEQSVAQAEILI